MTIRAFAPAKINLTLHVTGHRADGYHLLDSLVVFADVGDWLHVSQSTGISLRVTGPFSAGLPTGPENLVWRAADLMGGNVKVTLEKHLPPASGIGGGSSDAAATLRAIAELYKLPGLTDAQLLSLGADVPVCHAALTTRMEGVGECLTPLDWPETWAVLVNAGVQVPTGAVFEALASKTNAKMDSIPSGNHLDWLTAQRNDLETPARALVPEISETLDALRGAGASLARMSGSGATCFGLFEDGGMAGIAAAQIEALYPEWWVKPTRLCSAQHLTGPGS